MPTLDKAEYLRGFERAALAMKRYRAECRVHALECLLERLPLYDFDRAFSCLMEKLEDAQSYLAYVEGMRKEE